MSISKLEWAKREFQSLATELEPRAFQVDGADKLFKDQVPPGTRRLEVVLLSEVKDLELRVLDALKPNLGPSLSGDEPDRTPNAITSYDVVQFEGGCKWIKRNVDGGFLTTTEIAMGIEQEFDKMPD
jgi:hypothetical protein